MLYHVLVALDRLVVICTDVIDDTHAASQTFVKKCKIIVTKSVDRAYCIKCEIDIIGVDT